MAANGGLMLTMIRKKTKEKGVVTGRHCHCHHHWPSFPCCHCCRASPVAIFVHPSTIASHLPSCSIAFSFTQTIGRASSHPFDQVTTLLLFLAITSHYFSPLCHSFKWLGRGRSWIDFSFIWKIYFRPHMRKSFSAKMENGHHVT